MNRHEKPEALEKVLIASGLIFLIGGVIAGFSVPSWFVLLAAFIFPTIFFALARIIENQRFIKARLEQLTQQIQLEAAAAQEELTGSNQ